MKSFSTGLVAAIIVGAIGLIVLRSMGSLQFPTLSRPSPSPSTSATPSFEIASPSPSASASPSVKPSSSPSVKGTNTTKGGVVLGESTPKPSAKVTTQKTTTTKTVTHYTYTLAKTSDCPSNITSELKNIEGSLSVQYRIKDNYSASITMWNESGVEIASQKLYTGNGKIADTGSAKSIKVVIQPNKCEDKDDTWLEVIASR